MYPNVRLHYSPAGNAWNLFSASFSESGGDPGVPKEGGDEDDFPPVESSTEEVASAEIGGLDDDDQDNESSFGKAVDPIRTK